MFGYYGQNGPRDRSGGYASDHGGIPASGPAGLRGTGAHGINLWSRLFADIPMLIDLYKARKLKLDELLTQRYPFSQINEAYEALERGEGIRSVVTF